jgi:ubiquinol-cytochrome c reductase cytochrome c subunit
VGGERARCGGRIVILQIAVLLLAQAVHQPSSGNVLATPTPSATLDPAYAAHPTPADLREGEHLYNQHCASCHGLMLQGSPQAPPLVNADAIDVDFMLETGRMPAEAPWQQEYHKPTAFPRAQIQDIVSYVMSKSSGNKILPSVQLPGYLKHGREVWQENCEQCHAATGRGNSVGYRNVAPSVMDSSPEQIAEAVRMGPDVMPQFGPRLLSDRDMNDLITYVEYLQNAKYNPGGLQLSNWGPISEGFMAWTVGMGLLVLLVRRIGETE